MYLRKPLAMRLTASNHITAVIILGVIILAKPTS
jgi:hypothetical protein